MPVTDADIALLAARVRAGDAAAFKELFHALYPDLFRFLYRYTRDRQSAEDLAQETFVRLWKVRERLDPDLAPKFYLYRIARNLGIDYAADQKQTRRESDLPESVLVRLSYDPAEAYERSLLADSVQKGLSLLPERCRAVFLLARYHELSYEEIAVSLEISLQTVKNQMNKALSRLRKHLAEELE